ncbi:hypothetical protein ARTHRO9AX_190213 [Arthrobacter sp. 9AX]|nr:hypothetical protein ARTHRO9AX_190213 [Arthrobacter sp. 9AX]
MPCSNRETKGEQRPAPAHIRPSPPQLAPALFARVGRRRRALQRVNWIMDAIPALALIFGAAFAWLGLTIFVILRLRRRRSGSSVVASAPPPADPDGHYLYRPTRRVRAASGRARTRERRLHARKARR